MGWIRGLTPLALAAAIIACALGFVRYYEAYENPGEHWAPGAPVAGELAHFHADLKKPGDYIVQIDKLSSKFPLLFVEYQKPGMILRTRLASPDGQIVLGEQFADEGEYRIRIQRVEDGVPAPALDEVFRVQTPLAKYSVDMLLAVLLFFGGYASGRRLRALAAVALLAVMMGGGGGTASAHGTHHHDSLAGSEVSGNGPHLAWLNGVPHGAANRTPLNMGLKVAGNNPAADHLLFDLSVIHGETGRPVLTLSGMMDGSVLPLDYTPPDGADYRLRMRVASTMESRIPLAPVTLSAVMSADAIPPGALRKWESFAVLMLPALVGMALGWRRKE